MLTSQSGNVPIRPTSLEFINRPNPVEPDTGPGKHPLNGTLEQTPKDEFLRLLLEKDAERPTKRRKSGDPSPKSLDLPRLPVRNGPFGTKRLRIPPTLSGLHQPPPDAGLLPSMSVEQPLRLSDGANLPLASASVETLKPVEDTSSPSATTKLSETSETKSAECVVKRKHNKWSERETACLLKGVARFGIGQWTKILNCGEFVFEGRTALDLKDRFRVCCPGEYKGTGSKKTKSKLDVTPGDCASKKPEDKGRSRVKRSECVSSSQLKELGIDKPFEKSKRRGRTGYSAEEDEALLAGFRKHGNAWAAMRNDNEVLADRTATDLRDRFRTRYPEEYANAGLAPRPEQFPKKGKVHGKDDRQRRDASTKHQAIATLQTAAENQQGKENKLPTTAAPKMPPATSILQMDDAFWGAPFEPLDADSEQITLDRRILDWAYENTAKANGIDPLATLNLPRPTVTSATSGAFATSAGIPQTSATGSSVNALPSLASITAPHPWPNGMEAFNEEALELPSLMGVFGALETDARGGGHFMSMDELLS